MRKVLFLGYYFPPVGGSGVQRSIEFAKYLPANGWMPYVISSEPCPASDITDPSLLGDIPERVHVWRVPAPQPRPAARLRQLLSSRFSQAQTAASLPQGGKARGYGRAWIVARHLLSWPLRVVEHPPIDDQLYWSLRVVPLAWRLICKHKIDLLYTSSAPYSTLLTGGLLQMLSRCPWVADFRDPWTINSIVYRHSGFRRSFDQRVERLAILSADRVVVANHFVLRNYSRIVGDGTKFALITNGFDGEDFETAISPERSDGGKTVLAHFGTASPQALHALVEALTRLRSSDIGASRVQQLQIRLFGSWMNSADKEIVTSSAVADLFEVLGFVPHREVVQQMLQSDILLLFADASRYWATVLHGKLFEYIASGVPILAIAPEGAAVELIRRSATGCAVHPGDLAGLVSILEKISIDYGGFKDQFYDPQPNVIQEYERRLLTRRLADVFDSVLLE